MKRMIRRHLPLWAAVAALLGLASMSPACPFCTMQGKTLTTEVADASMVLYGKLVKANEKAETTDIEIEAVIKDNAIRGKKTRLTLSRFIDLTLTADKDRFVVFCDLFRGKIDPFRGLALKTGTKVPEYLRGALLLNGKPQPQRLRFFFDYLDNPDLEISNDAYKEFGNADYKDVRAITKGLPRERIIRWLENVNADDDKRTPAFRIGLYASLLGLCGTAKDAAVLRKLLDDPERRAGSGVDGLLAAYTMLEPKKGWNYLLGALKNTKEEFMFRYAALRSLRFLHDFRPDVIGKKELINGLCVLLQQDDIADLAIEDLRKWQVWDHTDKVLAVRKSDAFKLPIVKRAILRYCLQAPGASAAAYVTERRKADGEAVKEAEELLKLEQETISPSTASAKPVEKK
jgi:hypothetical protein